MSGIRRSRSAPCSTRTSTIGAILKESPDAEARTLELYRNLLEEVEGGSVALEEFARQMIQVEELHAAEVDKMLRKPGDVAAYAQAPATKCEPRRRWWSVPPRGAVEC